MLRGIDRAAFAVSLAGRLRRRGVDVGLPALESFTRALEAGRPVGVDQLYWTARITLVRQRSDLSVFDQVFRAAFADADLMVHPDPRQAGPSAVVGEDARHQPVPSANDDEPEEASLPWATLPVATGVPPRGADDDPGTTRIPHRLPSDLASRADTPFPELDPAELVALGRWLEQSLRQWPQRRTRRSDSHPSGRRIALRRTIHQARRTGWEPIHLVRTRPARRPRKVVMICDVSQSMQGYVTAYLHLMRAAALVTHAEVFAFSTSLTRLTPVLTHRSAQVAIEQAGERVTDRFGGTRIAANLAELMRSHRGGALRGAIVIVASDGWDSDEPAELARVMAKVHRRAHRVVWMNPRLAAPAFEPLVGAMAAAWPYCDAVLPADTLTALTEVVAAVADPPPLRRTTRAVGVSSRA